MESVKNILKNVFIFMFVLSIPALFALDSMQSCRYSDLENAVKALEKEQNASIETNKKLIIDIGILSSSARIEKLAVEKLGMHKAASDEILRIDIKDK